MTLVSIFFFGGLGCASRYLIGEIVNKVANNNSYTMFPWATLIANLLGSLLFVLVVTFISDKAKLRPALLIGFLGGLTTYSSFNFELLQMLQKAEFAKALTYLAVTLFGAMLCTWFVLRLTKIS